MGSDSFLDLEVQIVGGEETQLLKTVPFMDFIGSHNCAEKWTDSYKHVTSSVVLSMLLTEKKKGPKNREIFQPVEENGDNPILREFSSRKFFNSFMYRILETSNEGLRTNYERQFANQPSMSIVKKSVSSILMVSTEHFDFSLCVTQKPLKLILYSIVISNSKQNPELF